MDETLVTFGGEIKSMENGHFGGYLVRFTSADKPDLIGDYFTRETDFGIKDGQTSPVYFHHRQPLKTRDDQQIIIKAKIGEATMTIDDEGVLVDAIIFNREKYEKAIIKAGKARKSDGSAYLGWSSGTATHLCDRERRGGANFIKFWQLGFDSSITPTPCEPVNDAIPLKSLTTIKFLPLDEIELLVGDLEVKGAVGGWTTEGDYIHYRIKDPSDFEDKSFRTITIKKDKPVIKAVIGKLRGESSTTLQNLMFPTDGWTMAEAKKWVKDHPDTKKSFDVKAIDGQALFNESLRQTEQQIWELWSALQTGARKIAEVAALSNVTGTPVDIREALTGLVGAFNPQFIESATLQIEDWLKSENRDEHFYLKSSLFDEFIASGAELVSDSTLEDHSARVVSAVAEFAQRAEAISQPLKAWLMRLKDKQKFRADDPLKAGRVISQTNKDKMGTVYEQMSNLMTVLKEMQTSLTELMAMAEPKDKMKSIPFHLAITEHLNWRATHQ